MDMSNFYEYTLRGMSIGLTAYFFVYSLYKYKTYKFEFLLDFARSFALYIFAIILGFIYVGVPYSEMNFVIPMIQVIFFTAPSGIMFARASAKFTRNDTCWLCIILISFFAVMYLLRYEYPVITANAPIYMVLVGQNCIYLYLYKHSKAPAIKLMSIVATIVLLFSSIVFILLPTYLRFPATVPYIMIENVLKGAMMVLLVSSEVRWTKYKECGVAGIITTLSKLESQIEVMLLEADNARK